MILLSFVTSILLCSQICATTTHEPTIRVARYKQDKRCAISYTFDDGMKEHYTLVLPELEKHGFKGTFWICGGFIENNEGGWLTWSQVKEMADKGHEMSNHSWSHPNLTKLDREQLIREMEKNDSILLEKTGLLPRTFCYPYNAYNEEVLRVASAHRVGTRTQEYGIGTASTPEKLDQWIEDLLSSGGWGVAMIHGITEGYDAFAVPAVLWEHFDKVKAQEEHIWVGTFREVSAYTEAQKQIRLQITETDHSWTVLPELLLDKELFNEPLTLVVEKQGREISGVRQDAKNLPVYESADKIIFEFDPYGGEIQIELAPVYIP
ncbi:MAG: polysaccharide deacetylase family protein [Bacteroides sp.]|nr:polysaccharide deacetylase family protein [Bacteroides sp.]